MQKMSVGIALWRQMGESMVVAVFQQISGDMKNCLVEVYIRAH